MGYAGDAMNELHGTDVFTEERRLSGIAPDLKAEMERELPERIATTKSKSVVQEVAEELERARATHAPMNGHHEGYAVMLEEMDELWEVCKSNTHSFLIERPKWAVGDIDPNDKETLRQRKRDAMRKEAMQIAAMAVRFIEDVCDKKQ